MTKCHSEADNGNVRTMNQKLLWFVGRMQEATFIARLTEILSANHNLSSDLLTPFGSTRDRLQSSGYSCVTLADILKTVDFSAWPGEKLAEAANKLLAKLDINMLLHSDQLLYAFVDRAAAQTLISQSILAIHAFLLDGDYAGCLRYGTGSAIGRATSIIAESLKLPSYALCTCVGFNTCGLNHVGLEEQWRWTSFPKHWDRWQNRNVPKSERDRIKKYVVSYYESHRARPRTRLEQTTPQLMELERNRTWLKNCVALWRHGRCKGKCPEAVSESVLRDGNLDLLIPVSESNFFELKSEWLKNYHRFNYDQIPNKYIYMPLNYSWDAPHRAWNPMNYLQEYPIRIVQESLPYGYQLLVKEHPYGLGDPSHTKLQELQRIGVKVVDPHTHSLELIKNAQAVFCFGDTTGWEGILFKVPVVVFGAQPFYVDYSHVWHVTDINCIHHALREAVKSKHSAYSNENLWYSFIHSALESSYPGNIWGYKGLVWTDADQTEANLRNIAGMIAKEGDF